jgi:hypothetical protein
MAGGSHRRDHPVNLKPKTAPTLDPQLTLVETSGYHPSILAGIAKYLQLSISIASSQ